MNGMLRTRKIVVFSASIMLFMTSQSSSSVQSKTQRETLSRLEMLSKLDALESEMKQFANYEKDFSEFKKNLSKDSLDSEIADNFYSLSKIGTEQVRSAYVVLYVYSNLSCEADRAKVKGMIQTLLNNYLSRKDGEIQLINGLLSLAKNPALALTGTKLKEDLRAIKSLLESTRLQ
jgi:hypothetical protein